MNDQQNTKNMVHAHVPKATNTHTHTHTIQLSYYNNGCKNAPKFYVVGNMRLLKSIYL